MKVIFILIGIACIGFNVFYSGKPPMHQPSNFQTTGPKALMIGIISLAIAFFVF